ncbi:hypothetical protein L1887_44220 [Cichorium endivia]|nr:hypothetical protein L1887_44220 [Cichorium endivia]
MLKTRPCDRFLIHIIVKHFSQSVTGPGILRSAEMGITSAGLQTRNAGCGNQIRARTAALNVRKTMVHYLVSPPRPPLLKRTTSQS